MWIVKIFIIFAMLMIYLVFNTIFLTATGFEDLPSLRSKSLTLNEGGFFNKMATIYKISSKIKPERIYIGSAINFIRRRKTHEHLLKNKNHYNQKLQNHCNKYGIEDLNFEILELVMFKEDLIMREQFYLDTLNPYFNIYRIAYSKLGTKSTNKTKNKISRSRKGQKNSSKHNKNISLARMGIKLSKETIKKMGQWKRLPITKQRIREAMLGRKLSEEHRKNLSKALKGHIVSEETREKHRKNTIGKNNPMYGKKHSEETKKKISKAKKMQNKT